MRSMSARTASEGLAYGILDAVGLGDVDRPDAKLDGLAWCNVRAPAQDAGLDMSAGAMSMTESPGACRRRKQTTSQA